MFDKGSTLLFLDLQYQKPVANTDVDIGFQTVVEASLGKFC